MYFSELTGISIKDPHYLRDEVEAYSLPIIINIEKDTEISHEDALEAAANGVRDFLLSKEIQEDGMWHEVTKAWLAGHIRKITRRARGSAWERVIDLNGIMSSSGAATVFVLPPHKVEEIPLEIKKLQVQGLNLPSKGHSAKDAEIFVALNPVIEISTGKAMAQIGHATQLAIMGASEIQLERWVEQKPEISLIEYESRPKWDFHIEDAGFTEIAPGTTTAFSATS